MSTLYIMCGIPASGKSTLIKNFPLSIMEELTIFQSDVARKDILTEYGFPDAIHQNTISNDELSLQKKREIEDKVWKRVIDGTKYFLGENKTVVIDATNTEQKVLDDWFIFATEHDHKVKIIIMTTPLNVCIKRNNARESPVPDDVMNYMYNSYIQTIGWLYMNHNEKIINSAHL